MELNSEFERLLKYALIEMELKRAEKNTLISQKIRLGSLQLCRKRLERLQKQFYTIIMKQVVLLTWNMN